MPQLPPPAPDFKDLVDSLYNACHATDPNARVEAARRLYQRLVGAPPVELEDRIKSLIALNQQLQDQVNTTKAAVNAEWQAKYDALEARLPPPATPAGDVNNRLRASYTRRLRVSLQRARGYLDQLEGLDGD